MGGVCQPGTVDAGGYRLRPSAAARSPTRVSTTSTFADLTRTANYQEARAAAQDKQAGLWGACDR